MIKRTKKMVSLLIAGVSVLSIAPTTVAHAESVTKLESQEGEISNAVAFNGGYLYEGYKDDADSGLYISDGDSDKILEDQDGDELDSSEIVRKYGDKSVVLDDEDEYLVDLSTGVVSDEDTAESLNDDAYTKLKREHRKVERYEDYELSDNLEEVSAPGFVDETLYKYTYTDSTTSAAVYVGFTNQSGDYVDVSQDANVYFYNGDKAVKIKEYSEAGTTEAETAILQDVQVIAQDKDYIYAIATVDINVSVNADGTVNKVTNKYLQKISKSQGDQEDDAYLPSSTTSYLLTKSVDEDEVSDAYDLLLDANGDLNEDVTVNAVDGKLVVTSFDGDTATVTSLITKNTKVTPIVTAADGTTSEEDKVSLYAVSVDDDDDVDATAVTFDVDGNTWVLDSGKIYKSEKGGDFEQVYKCDSSFDKIDVYNQDNLIVWSEDDEDFAVVYNDGVVTTDPVEDPTTDPTTPTTPAPIFTNGWNLRSDGKWLYSVDGSTLVKGNWLNDKGTWYYLDENGVMATGWLNQNGTWYFLNASGSMATGWVNDNGTWYFLNANGSMAHDTTVDGYKLGSNGALV